MSIRHQPSILAYDFRAFGLMPFYRALKGWLSTLCCWEAAVHIVDYSRNKMDVKLMLMIIMLIVFR